jgi:hypothetical protein
MLQTPTASAEATLVVAEFQIWLDSITNELADWLTARLEGGDTNTTHHTSEVWLNGEIYRVRVENLARVMEVTVPTAKRNFLENVAATLADQLPEGLAFQTFELECQGGGLLAALFGANKARYRVVCSIGPAQRTAA